MGRISGLGFIVFGPLTARPGPSGPHSRDVWSVGKVGSSVDRSILDNGRLDRLRGSNGSGIASVTVFNAE
jgi:hypothetical protein